MDYPAQANFKVSGSCVFFSCRASMNDSKQISWQGKKRSSDISNILEQKSCKRERQPCPLAERNVGDRFLSHRWRNHLSLLRHIWVNTLAAAGAIFQKELYDRSPSCGQATKSVHGRGKMMLELAHNSLLFKGDILCSFSCSWFWVATTIGLHAVFS